MANKTLVTPVGVASYPYLLKADFGYDDGGVYQSKLSFPKDASASAFAAAVDAAMEESFVAATAQAKGRKVNRAASPVVEDNNGYTLKAKLKATGVNHTTKQVFTQVPKIFDNKNAPWDPEKQIWSGSKLKLQVELVPYYTKGEAGITLRLKAAQVLELVSSDAEKSPFGAAAPEDYSGLAQGPAGDSDDAAGDF